MRRLGVAVLLLLLSTGARADRVILQNGDQLSGRIVSKDEAVLRLQTDYAGELTIRWSAVVAVHTDEPVQLLRSNGEWVQGRLIPAEPGALGIEAPAAVPAAQRIALSELAYINPTEAQAGTGVEHGGRITLSFDRNRGNTERDRQSADGEYRLEAKDWRLKLNARGEKAVENGRRSAANWLANTNFDTFLAEERFLFGRSSLEHDRLADLRLRSTLALGYGWQLLATDRTEIALRVGPAYIRELYYDESDQRYPALTWNADLSHRLPMLRTELYHEHEGFVRYESINQLILRTRTGLRVPLVERLTASVQLNYDLDTQPSDDQRKTDSALTLGLGYEW